MRGQSSHALLLIRVTQVGHHQVDKTDQKADDQNDDPDRYASEIRIDSPPADIGVDRKRKRFRDRRLCNWFYLVCLQPLFASMFGNWSGLFRRTRDALEGNRRSRFLRMRLRRHLFLRCPRLSFGPWMGRGSGKGRQYRLRKRPELEGQSSLPLVERQFTG